MTWPVNDALNGLAYDDDAQVFSLAVRAQYSDTARTVVRMTLYDQPAKGELP